MKCNKQQLCELLGIGAPSIDLRIKDGMPFKKRGNKTTPWVFETRDVIQWEKGRAVSRVLGKTGQVSHEELRARKLSAETQLQELELLKSVGKVIPIDEVDELIKVDYLVIRERLLCIGGHVAPLIAGEGSEIRIQTIIKEEVHSALSDLLIAKIEKH